ncbi:OmpA family protein [Olivibacter sp. SDN3]|uniref:OmpA family protein n=1 Tax=Olivibacter sp. SDN3 TaxID=2764720 RepID=UPI0021080BFA|nr:OmpA family protein [Olivibacter sp. SDN3]
MVKLGGHADSIGPYVYNWHLSKSRADEVKSYLVSKGVDETRISSTEFGNTQPIASNETAEGRQKNRRVEIEVVE